MKSHLPKKGNRRYGVEWLQAIFTLLVLTGIYLSSGNFVSQVPILRQESKSVQISVPYWNSDFWYGFHANPGDTYQNQTSSGIDTVSILSSSSGTLYSDAKVKVSFYPNATIDDIENNHPADVNRAYSRLSTGIAVIEWDLASATAKVVLSTLHSR